MATPRTLYPLGTQDGKSIPFDAVRPMSTYFVTLGAAGVSNLEPSAEANVYILYSTVDCLVSFQAPFGGVPVADTVYADAFFLPAHTQMTIVSEEGTGQAISMSGNGRLYVTQVERWSALGTQQQTTRR